MRRRLISLMLAVSMVASCFAAVPVMAVGDITDIGLDEVVETTIDRYENQYFSFTSEETGKYAVVYSKGTFSYFDSSSMDVFEQTEYDGMIYNWFWMSGGKTLEFQIGVDCDDDGYTPDSRDARIFVTRGFTKLENKHFNINGEDRLENYIAHPGEDLTITAVVDPDPDYMNLRYQWFTRDYSDYHESDDFTLMPGETGDTIQIPNFSKSADYRCKVYAGQSETEYVVIEASFILYTFDISDGFYEASDIYRCNGMTTISVDYEDSVSIVYPTMSTTETPVDIDYEVHKSMIDGPIVASGTVAAGEDVELTIEEVKGNTLYFAIFHDEYGNEEVRDFRIWLNNSLTASSTTDFILTEEAQSYILEVNLKRNDPDVLLAWCKPSPSGLIFPYDDSSRMVEYDDCTAIMVDGLDQSAVSTRPYIEYRCYALSRIDRTITDKYVSFYFRNPDYFDAYPQGMQSDIEVEYGTNAVMKVATVGGTDVTYQWYTCDSNGIQTVIGGAKNFSLTRTSAQIKTNHDYTCVVTSGTEQRSVDFHVEFIPTFTCLIDNKEIECEEGEPVTLSLENAIIMAEGYSPSAIRYQWYSYLRGDLRPIDGATGSSYTTPPLVAANENYHVFHYVCEVTNNINTVYADFLAIISKEGSPIEGITIRQIEYPQEPLMAGEAFDITLDVIVGEKYWTAEVYDWDTDEYVFSKRYFGANDGESKVVVRFEDGIEETHAYGVYIYTDDGFSDNRKIDIYVGAEGLHEVFTGLTANAYIEVGRYQQEGGIASFRAGAENGYILKSLTIIERASGNEINYSLGPDGKYCFVMPWGDVVITAVAAEIGEDGLYPITVAPSIFGIVGASAATAKAGDVIELDVYPNSDYELDRIVVITDDGTVNVDVDSNNCFVMPSGAVYVKAFFIEGNEILQGSCDNGIFGLSKTKALAGTSVRILTYPDYGYELDKITVVDPYGNEIPVDQDGYFIMPDSEVTVSVYFKLIGADPIQTGWIKEDGVWHYYNEAGVKQSGWINIDGIYYYLDPANNDGMATGWLEIGNKWYHFKNDGAMTKGWYSAGSSWWYFDGSGAMVTSWKKIDNKWYFFDRSSGVMMTGGWKKIDDVWYYFRESGNIATGWEQINGKYYYFDNNGVMQTGWIKDNNKWYYLNPQGDMKANSWLEYNGSWYYFSGTGAMVAGTTWTLNGVTYRFDANGVCQNPYGDPTDGWVKIDGVYYYYNGGEAVTGWNKIAKKWYYLDPDNGGAMWIGWLEEGGYTFYMDNSGAMVANRTITIDGTEYTFDASGHLK